MSLFDLRPGYSCNLLCKDMSRIEAAEVGSSEPICPELSVPGQESARLRRDFKAGMRYVEFARYTMEPPTNKDVDEGLLYLYQQRTYRRRL